MRLVRLDRNVRLAQERVLAEKIAAVRVALAVINLLVLNLQALYPASTFIPPTSFAASIALAFFVYALLAWWFLQKRRLNMDVYELGSPLVDIFLTASLVQATGVAESPFNLMFAFAVVATGFSSRPLLALGTCILALSAHLGMALREPPESQHLGFFAVRTTYLFGFAFITALLSSYLRVRARNLLAIEAFGRKMNEAANEPEACRYFVQFIEEAFNASCVNLRLVDREPVLRGENVAGREYERTYQVGASGEHYGSVALYKQSPFRAEEEQLLRIIVERLGSAIRKFRVSDSLVATTAKEERLKYADELHDSFLQTLAGIDLYCEAAKIHLEQGKDEEAKSELNRIKEVAREASRRARTFIQGEESPSRQGPDVIHQIFKERWQGNYEVSLDGAHLSHGQWGAAEALVREGVNNAKTHGKATKLSFRIMRQAGLVVVKLENDGVIPKEDFSFGFGLKRLDATVRANGGSLILERLDGGGAALIAIFGEVEPS